MAHRSVRLAKRPGPHNSRDASSTTLRAIVGPLAPSRLLFSPHGRIPSYRDGTRDVDYSTCLARGNAQTNWNRLFRRNACIKHTTTRVEQYLHEFRKQKNYILLVPRIHTSALYYIFFYCWFYFSNYQDRCSISFSKKIEVMLQKFYLNKVKINLIEVVKNFKYFRIFNLLLK